MGGLLQLVAYGAPDVFLIGNTCSPYCYNNRDSMLYFFIDKDDGFPSKADLLDVIDQPLILDHVPEHLRSLSIKKERAVYKIQKAWRNAISNPAYKLCQDRLLKEYNEF